MASDSLLYRGKYRRPTNRAHWWDWYEGIYFVTLNTQNRRHDFGEIEWDAQCHQKIMRHSIIGKFADEEIPKIMEHHPYAYIPSWIVMPDHIHLIIMIDVRGRMKNYSFDDEINLDSAVRTARRDDESCARRDDDHHHESCARRDDDHHDSCTRRDHDSCARCDNEIYVRRDDDHHDSCTRRDHDSCARCDNEINHDDEMNLDNAVRTARRDDESCARRDDDHHHESCARRDDDHHDSCTRRDHDSCARCDNEIYVRRDHDSCARCDNEIYVRRDDNMSKRMSEIAPKHGSLGSVIGQYKRAVTMHARMNHLPFQWQTNYYARILKDQYGFDCVKRYIDNNVAKWEIKP